MLNRYETRFAATCPVNEKRIDYDLRIDTDGFIPVESILSVIGKIGRGMHEEIADKLFAELGGRQRLEAFHHGVHITTERP